LKIISSKEVGEKPEPWGSSKILFKNDKTKSEIGLFKCSAGKSMDMPLSYEELMDSLSKQFRELELSIMDFRLDIILHEKQSFNDVKRRIADLRNVAGCLFLLFDILDRKNPL